MRPKIICHMMSSVDGGLRTDRYSPLLNNENINVLFEIYGSKNLEFKADSFMLGSASAKELTGADFFDQKKFTLAVNPSQFIAKRTTEDAMIIFDSTGSIAYKESLIMNTDVIVVLSRNVSEEYLSNLRDLNISYTFIDNDKNIEKVLTSLSKDFGMKKLVLTGGGTLNGSFLTAGLIDELMLLICPAFDGFAGSQSIFDYPGESENLTLKNQSLELISIEKIEFGGVYLHYKIHNSKINS